MIEIVYNPDALTVEATGHAGAAPYGQDMVCCAISVLMQTLEATGRRVGTVKSSIAPGHAAVQVLPYPLQWMEAEQRVEAIVDGLREVARSYPQFVRIRRGVGLTKL
nr:MAG TPA: YsxB-like protein [Caudoviricetes sp.]